MFHDQCPRFTTRPPTINTAFKPLGATPQTKTLHFLIPVDKLVLYGSQHHLLLFIDLRYPCGRLSQRFSHTLALLLPPPVLLVKARSP